MKQRSGVNRKKKYYKRRRTCYRSNEFIQPTEKGKLHVQKKKKIHTIHGSSPTS